VSVSEKKGGGEGVLSPFISRKKKKGGRLRARVAVPGSRPGDGGGEEEASSGLSSSRTEKKKKKKGLPKSIRSQKRKMNLRGGPFEWREEKKGKGVLQRKFSREWKKRKRETRAVLCGGITAQGRGGGGKKKGGEGRPSQRITAARAPPKREKRKEEAARVLASM